MKKSVVYCCKQYKKTLQPTDIGSLTTVVTFGPGTNEAATDNRTKTIFTGHHSTSTYTG